MALSSAELPNFVCGEPRRPGTKSTEWPRCHPDASSGPSAPPHRADTAARATSWSRIVVVSQPESNASSPVAREIDPTLCRPAGPSRRILCQLPRRCIARARNLCTNWLHQLQLRAATIAAATIVAVALVKPLPRPSVGRGTHPRVVKAGSPTLARQQQHRSSKHSDQGKRHAAKIKPTSGDQVIR